MNMTSVLLSYIELHKRPVFDPSIFYFQTSVVMSLLQSYELLSKMKVIVPRKATLDELSSFHSKQYLELCDKISGTNDHEKLLTTLDERLKSVSSSVEVEFGVTYDCPIVPNISSLIAWLAGGSLCKI